jgi:hypothetical protein
MRIIILTALMLHSLLAEAQQPMKISESAINKNIIHGIIIRNSSKHDSAMKYTSGVMGSSFFGDQWIGVEKQDGYGLGQGNYYPIDGFKRTHTGLLLNHYIRRIDGNGDDDVNFYITPDPRNTHLLQYLARRSNKKKASEWRQINGEIDVADHQKKQFYPYLPHMPLAGLNIVNAYGPFVHDADDYIAKHHDYIEIHPSEQLWWTNVLNIGLGKTTEYHLMLMRDASSKFNNDRWTSDPLPGIFAIAFTVNTKAERLRYVGEIVNSDNVNFRSTDGIKHVFRFNNTPLVEVNEPEANLVDVSFEEVHIDQQKLQTTGDTILKGFVVFKTSVGKAFEKLGDRKDGNLMLKVSANTLNANWGFAAANAPNSVQVKVTLNHIKVVRAIDNDNKEDLYGYVGAGAYDPLESIPKALIRPVEAVNPSKGNLLWYSLDDNNDRSFNSIINLASNESKVFRESRLFVVTSTSVIRLVADINEDDGDYDDNPTSMDGGLDFEPVDALEKALTDENADDPFNKFCDQCTAEIAVRTLRLHVPINKIFKFGASGGNLVEVSYTIERVK